MQYVCLDFKIINKLYIFYPASALKLKIADNSCWLERYLFILYL